MHVRQAIREAAVTAVTGLTTTGSRVFDTRVFPLSESNLPCLAVYMGDEDIEGAGLGGTLDRRAELIVRGYAKATSQVEDTLDSIIEEVETALTSVAGTKDMVISGISTEFSDEGDMPTGSVEIRFLVFYQTAEGAPATAL